MEASQEIFQGGRPGPALRQAQAAGVEAVPNGQRCPPTTGAFLSSPHLERVSYLPETRDRRTPSPYAGSIGVRDSQVRRQVGGRDNAKRRCSPFESVGRPSADQFPA